jgi:hypothetical protein
VLASARRRAALAGLAGLGERDVLALQYVVGAEALTPGELGRLLGLSSGGTTALVQRLEQAGHLVRERNPGDRRSHVLRLVDDATRWRVVADDVIVTLSALHAPLTRAADAAERDADELAAARRAAADAAPGLPVPGLWG